LDSNAFVMVHKLMTFAINVLINQIQDWMKLQILANAEMVGHKLIMSVLKVVAKLLMMTLQNVL
jgi:hypothetical protein